MIAAEALMRRRLGIWMAGLAMPALLALAGCPPVLGGGDPSDDDDSAVTDDDDFVDDDDFTPDDDDDNVPAYGVRVDDRTAAHHPEYLKGLRAA
jgi:hypothetical protein